MRTHCLPFYEEYDLSVRLDKAELCGLAVAIVATPQGCDTALFECLTQLLMITAWML